MEYTTITSRSNPQIKEWRKLTSTRGRKKAGAYLIEGFHLVEEAVAHGVPIRHLIITEAMRHTIPEYLVENTPQLTIIHDSIVSELAQTATPQGIFAVVSIEENLSAEDIKRQRLLLLDHIQDPGNLGTMIRTADAAGFDAVILGEGTVDMYNDKVIRSTQGSLWHLPVLNAKLDQFIPYLQSLGVHVYATTLQSDSTSLYDIDPSPNSAIIMGNEGQGIDPILIHLADETVYIPMSGAAESLNVAVAAGIVMFQFRKI